MREREHRRGELLDFERSIRRQGAKFIAGVDEAGRGPLAGPVVAAAVIFPEGVYLEGIDDSKKLSAQRREALYGQIYEHAISVGIGIVSHEVIDRINIYHASILAMRKAVGQLSQTPELILADGNSFVHETLPFQNVINGDARCFSIAAASIIAKVTRDSLMREYDLHYPGYGFARHKGYGTPEHLEAIKRCGPCEIHRRSFRLPEWPGRESSARDHRSAAAEEGGVKL